MPVVKGKHKHAESGIRMYEELDNCFFITKSTKINIQTEVNGVTREVSERTDLKLKFLENKIKT